MSPEPTNSPLLTPRPAFGTKEMLTVVFVVGALASLPVLTLLMMIVDAYALTVLWGWFVVPLFQLPALTMPLAMGLRLVAGMLTGSLYLTQSDTSANQQDEKKEEPASARLSAARRRLPSQLLRALLKFLSSGLIPLGIGWIVHRFFL